MTITYFTKRAAFISVLLFGVFNITACSTRWREGSTGKSVQEVQTQLDAVMQTNDLAAAGADSAYLGKLLADPSKFIYYAENGEKLGPIHTVFPVDFAALTGGVDTPGAVGTTDLKDAHIYFITRKNNGQFDGALIIEYKSTGSTDWKRLVFQNSGDGTIPAGSIDNEDFRMGLVGPNSLVITAFSDDLNSSKDDLGSTIQLSLYDDQNRFLGKVSTMEGL